MKRLFFFILVCQAAVWMQGKELINYKKVNAQARKEYCRPVRPGTNGINPFWNAFARKFLYAPAFDFPVQDGASSYLFRLSDGNGMGWQMKAHTPKTDLGPVWDRIPAGTRVHLAVFALDNQGRLLPDTLGQRTFLRDFPYRGPYCSPVRPYKEAAMMGMLYLHRMKAIRSWLDHQEPDMSYRLHTYACKIMGSTIRNECLVAKYFPAERERALLMARNVAAFLRSVSQPEDAPLAFFPPTYLNGLVFSSGINALETNKTTMCMEAVTVAEGLLDLYDETHDKQYFDWVLGIADTYRRLQHPDGSLPIKLMIETGEPVNDRCAMLHPLLFLLRRLHDAYGVEKYVDMQRMGEEWMHNVAIKNFDMTGQFEDVSVLNLKPYENLTNCTAAPYADYLCSKPHPTDEDLRDAEDLLRLSEDQFVHWEMPAMPDGLPPHVLPCVFEQYKFQQSVDSSVCDVAGGFLAHYHFTGSQLSLAKAISLTNAITVAQDARSGFLPTIWERTISLSGESEMWLNCALHSIQQLLRMDDVTKGF